MIRGALRLVRYGRSWLEGSVRVEEREVELDRSDRTVPATLFVRRGGRRPLPGWIVLHGVTRPGRRHRELVRFARALAHSGAAVIIPEVPEWVELDLAPATTAPTVRGSAAWLRSSGLVAPDVGLGLVGFSFGAPQALIASTDPDLGAELGAVVGFGGYFDLERVIRFQLTGRHEWRGRTRTLPPDPYGRWIVAANFLPSVPGCGDAADVAEALRNLAKEAGDRQISAADPVFDPVKRTLRDRVAAERRDLFDLFAPPADRQPDPDAAGEWVGPLVEAAHRAEPVADPGETLRRVRVPVHLLHGRNDRLIPFTETLRMAEHLPDEALAQVTVTGLFAHSRGHDVVSLLERGREASVFAVALGRVLDAV